MTNATQPANPPAPASPPVPHEQPPLLPVASGPEPPPPLPVASHTPPRHVPPEHGRPSGLTGIEHVLLVLSQTPNSWQSSFGAHGVAAAVQAPD